MQDNIQYSAGLYLRLSKDDEQQGESVSIGTQRAILTDYHRPQTYNTNPEKRLFISTECSTLLVSVTLILRAMHPHYAN